MASEASESRRPIWLVPNRWPVRWRLAAVSASLTLLILLCFAFVVGRLVSDRMHDDFRQELERRADELANAMDVEQTAAGPRIFPRSSAEIVDALTERDGALRIVDGTGRPVPGDLPPAPDLGPPRSEVQRVGGLDVASEQIITTTIVPPVFVQYARSRDSLEETTDRLWLFLGGGVLGGTILALLAGLAVAGRAMRPIKDLTQTAREIAATRDPSRRVPMPQSNDEIAELARTLDEMLRELDAARGETEQMAQAQREFVADASHELRTPLTSILANLELLQERLGVQGANGEEAEMVDGALSSSRRMRRLVSDLLLLARADAGRAGARSECDLAEIASSALAEVKPVADDHELIATTSEPVPIEGNPDELHRLVVNLLENGIRHSPAGTRIQVVVRRDGDEAVLEVADDGPGIPPGMEEQVFSRFVRGAGAADTVADGGTGLGLAIVQAVAASHGGRVTAGEAPHGGARFEVRLPLAQRAAVTAQPKATAL
jgi:two-component system, OmpR family, sensor kinase